MEKIHIALRHLGFNSIQYEILRIAYYLNNMISDIRDFISKCPTCTSTKLN